MDGAKWWQEIVGGHTDKVKIVRRTIGSAIQAQNLQGRCWDIRPEGIQHVGWHANDDQLFESLLNRAEHESKEHGVILHDVNQRKLSELGIPPPRWMSRAETKTSLQ